MPCPWGQGKAYKQLRLLSAKQKIIRSIQLHRSRVSALEQPIFKMRKHVRAQTDSFITTCEPSSCSKNQSIFRQSHLPLRKVQTPAVKNGYKEIRQWIEDENKRKARKVREGLKIRKRCLQGRKRDWLKKEQEIERLVVEINARYVEKELGKVNKRWLEEKQISKSNNIN